MEIGVERRETRGGWSRYYTTRTGPVHSLSDGPPQDLWKKRELFLSEVTTGKYKTGRKKYVPSDLRLVGSSEIPVSTLPVPCSTIPNSLSTSLSCPGVSVVKVVENRWTEDWRTIYSFCLRVTSSIMKEERHKKSRFMFWWTPIISEH